MSSGSMEVQRQRRTEEEEEKEKQRCVQRQIILRRRGHQTKDNGR